MVGLNFVTYSLTRRECTPRQNVSFVVKLGYYVRLFEVLQEFQNVVRVQLDWLSYLKQYREGDGFRVRSSGLLHQLRVTPVTRLVQYGVDTRIIQDQIGHRSDDVSRYKRTNEIQLKNASKILQCSEPKITTIESSKLANSARLKTISDSRNQVQIVVIDDNNNTQKQTLSDNCSKDYHY